MGKLLRAQIYRSLHDKILWLLILLTFLLCVLFWNGMNIRSIGALKKEIDLTGFRATAGAYGWDVENGAKEEDAFFDYYVSYSAARMLREVNPIRFFALYAAAYLIGSKFTQRTIHFALFRGYSRGRVVLAAFIAYLLLIVFTLLAAVFVYLLLKFGGRIQILFSSLHFWRNMALWLYLAVSYMSLSFAAVFLVRNIFGTLLASFGLMLSMVILPTGSFRGEILSGSFADFLPLGIMEKEMLWLQHAIPDTRQIIFIFIIPLFLILLSLGVSYFGYRNKTIL